MKKEPVKEQRHHSTAYKPFSYYISDIPLLFPGVPLHYHEEFELNLITEGEAEFVTGDRHFTARSGDIVFVPPDMLHAVNPSENKHAVYDTFVFNSSMLGSRESDRGTDDLIRPLLNGSFAATTRITPDHLSYTELHAAAKTIIFAAKGDNSKLDILIKSELLKFIYLLYESGDIVKRSAVYGQKSELIRPIVAYINDHFTEELTIDHLAGKAHLSKSYFMNTFKKTAGISAIEYVNQLRLKKALELLDETSMNISHIAFECGFRNLSNFNRQFRTACGCSPREYKSSRGTKTP